jgi:energy-coupling factor transporter ATP-binding protein EcfA2
MRERLTHLAVEAFRGVPNEWSVEWPDGASMVVRGDNGTGKSTIADALEWYFTGRIEFLAREGRERSIRHVGAPKTRHTLVAVRTNGSLSGRQSLPPSGRSPWFTSRIPDNFVLRGRTLSDFVEKPKAEKWKALASVLGLRDADQLRLDLQTVKNQLEEEASARKDETKRLGSAMRPSLKTISDVALLAAIRDGCTTIGVTAPTSLSQALDPGWLPEAASSQPDLRAVELSTLRADIQVALQSRLSLDGIDTWNSYLLSADASLRDRQRFMAAANTLLASSTYDGRCPLCGQLANRASIEARVTEALEELQAASAEHERAESSLRRAINGIQVYGNQLEDLRRRLSDVKVAPPIDVPTSPVDSILECLKEGRRVSDASVREFLQGGHAWLSAASDALTAFPASPSRDSRLVEVATLCEQGRRWLSARERSAAASAAFALADRLHATYQRVEVAHYRSILSAISARVAELYSTLHPNEGFAAVAIEPWTDKGLELAVDFHGTHQRPPHGVLSESHLNSLAVALFLAMAEMFNERLNFVVLDDIVNSFDVEHRGRLAELLVKEFDDRQLIVLTHDHQFYLHLARRAPAWITLELASWTFDEGPRPTKYATARLIETVRVSLADGDIQGAGQKARRALEEILDEACEAMGAALPFRRGHANDRRELTELISGLRSKLKSSSRAWYSRLDPLLTNLEADVQAALNVEVHTGPGWASIQEVEAALQRIQALDGEFTCHFCGSRIWAEGSRDAARCSCGRSTYPPASS